MSALHLPLERDELPLGWLGLHSGASQGWSVGVVGLETDSTSSERRIVPALSLHVRLHHNWIASTIREAAAALAKDEKPPALRALLLDGRKPAGQRGWPARGPSGSADLVRGWEAFRSACLDRLADDPAMKIRELGAVAPWAFFVPEVNDACREVLSLPHGLSADDVAMVAALKHVRPPGRGKAPPEVELAPSFRHFCDTFLVEGSEFATVMEALSAAQVRALSRHYFGVEDGYRQREKMDRYLKRMKEALAWNLVVPFPEESFAAASMAVTTARMKDWAYQPALVKRLFVCCRGDVSLFEPYSGVLRGFAPLEPHWSVPSTPTTDD